MKNFKTPYSKPKKFTGKFSDFPPKTHKDILNLKSDELTWWHYQVIFHFGCNAGTYSECCFFLPRALDYLARDTDDSYEIISNILFFIAAHEKVLKDDKLFEKCEEKILSILDNLTNQFEIIHYDIKQCEEIGWCTDYQNVVKNSETVNEIIENLLKHDSLNSILDTFMVTKINLDGEATNSAWYIELYRHLQVDGIIGINNIEKYYSWFQSNDIILAHFDKAASCSSIIKTPSYLDDIKNILKNK